MALTDQSSLPRIIRLAVIGLAGRECRGGKGPPPVGPFRLGFDPLRAGMRRSDFHRRAEHRFVVAGFPEDPALA